MEIVAWLNKNPGVKEVLRDHFGGRPINEQNLTEWKAGGYPEWLRHVETREEVVEWIGEAQDLEMQSDDYTAVVDHLSAPLAVELGRCLKEVAHAEGLGGKERREAVVTLVRASSQLQRANHSGRRLSFDMQWKETFQEAAWDAEREKRQGGAQMFRDYFAGRRAEEAPREPVPRVKPARKVAAEAPVERKRGVLDPGNQSGGGRQQAENRAPESGNPTMESDEIRVNQAKSNQIPVENISGTPVQGPAEAGDPPVGGGIPPGCPFGNPGDAILAPTSPPQSPMSEGGTPQPTGGTSILPETSGCRASP